MICIMYLWMKVDALSVSPVVVGGVVLVSLLT